MPHRANKDLAPKHALPSLVEDDEEDEQILAGTYRPRPSVTSAPATSRSRHGARPARPGHPHSAPGSSTPGKAPRSRINNVYSQFNQRYRQTSNEMDDNSLYFAPETDSEDDELHSRRASANGIADPLGLDSLTADEEVEPETAEDVQRLEWQSMLASVLNGDVLRSEKTRIGRALESYEAQRINRLDLWQELRARPRGRTIEQEKELLDERRRRTVGPLVDEIMHFKLVSPEAPEDDSDEPPNPARHVSSDDRTALKHVASLLRRWDGAEALYPNLKAMRQDWPDCSTPEFITRLETLNSWFSVYTAIRRSIDKIKQLTGSEKLDVQSKQPDGSHIETADGTKAGGERQQPETTSFVERILKEDGLQRTFERGALEDLHTHIHNARDLFLTFSETMKKMGLPSFTNDLVTTISFPTQLMEEVLRVRLHIAQQVAEPSLLSVDQMLDDFRLAIGLACTLKSDYEELIQPDADRKWNLPPCIGAQYEDTILSALRFFFKLIHQKLKSAHKGIYFKETELLEAQWYILEEVTMATKGGGLLVAEHVCSLTNKLILRVITSFQGQIQLPAYRMDDDSENVNGTMGKYSEDAKRKQNKPPPEVTAEETIRWFSKVLDGVRLRHRKLQRYSRLLTSRFGNSAEYSLEGVTVAGFLANLVATGHFLVYTETYESKGLYIIGDPSLYDTPELVRQMLLKAFHVASDFVQDGASEVGSDYGTIDLEGGQYLLVLTPQENFVWRGTVLVLSIPDVPLGISEMRCRLIAPSPAKLNVAKQKFASYFMAPTTEDDETLSESDLEPPLQVVVEQQAHLTPVNRELRKISRATQKLAEVIVDSVHDVKKILANVQGAQELMENWFLFASEHGQAALKFADQSAQVRLSRLLTRLSISWVAFICDNCEPTDRKTFRWAVNALEFAMVRTRGTNILQLSESDFKLLQQKVASCMTLLISHFDILGARSIYEEKEKQREKEETAKADEALTHAALLDGVDETLPMESDFVVWAPQDRSLRAFSDRVARGIAEADAARERVHVEQHIAGRVLMDESAEDESLTFLAATASKTSIKWQQGRFIGAGAFGSVYLALNLDTGGVMAVKEIRFKSSTSLSTLYQQVKDELAVMEVLNHPNIVEYYGIEVHRDKVYIFEEYCGGGTLTSLLESGRIEDETVVKVYTMQMLEGLMYLHSMGVVHRDIKPDNILLDHNGIIKFVDFGAAKILAKTKGSIHGRSMFAQPPATPAIPNIPGMNLPMTSLTGTPMYMSPEVIKSDRRSRKGAMDIWSMGCVVLECVTGRKPWSNLDNEWAIMFHIGVATQHPPLPEPGQLSSMGIDFIRQCLTIDGMKRPSAGELYDHPWILAFREELAAYDQEEILQTPSLKDASLRTDFTDSIRDSMKPVSPTSREKMYDSGMISPPGIFSDTADHGGLIANP